MSPRYSVCLFYLLWRMDNTIYRLCKCSLDLFVFAELMGNSYISKL